ncbi:arginine repressor [Sphingomicrobium sediminis]|uniref:Arginine repressor n=1 Tax=Sphingomicrobium sediminis TaxID=2950949 RepID=A0A9X2EHP9_9SPHN|nr:hypothetical protein [Sphingomicrobium sediminis]MCM8558228.1 hypothetical protein [Sphingomicrobium sediminis]
MSRVEERRRALAAMLREGGAASQEELVSRLSDAGHPTTQATVSRDLDAIGAIKGKKDGKTAYLLAEQLSETNGPSAELDRILGEWLRSAEAASGMVILRTRPGSAHVVGAALDAAQLSDIAGTIAGDDTLFIALRDGFDARALADKLSGNTQ